MTMFPRLRSFLRTTSQLSQLLKAPVERLVPIQCFHVTHPKRDLMEFFDDKNNWGKSTVRVGRSWTKDELRLKSNVDLHKLWYVLLKERNMLLTMEAAYKKEVEPMPNPERLDKVEDSMENLECVVRERNRAYFELEVGESGERERIIRPGPFGFEVGYKKCEHQLPWRLNASYRRTLRHRFATSHGPKVRWFLAKYREQMRKREGNQRLNQMRRCAEMLQQFPNASEEAIKEKYPLVNVNVVKRWYKVKGHHSNDQFNV